VICKAIKNDNNELAALDLAGDGWKTVYIDYVKSVANRLNTPKSDNIDKMFDEILGVNELSSQWSHGRNTIDEFVKLRGEIAHKGGSAIYPKISDLLTYKDMIEKTIKETDNYISDYIKNTTGKKPWNLKS
jgi:RiboL-PSP-HEPN